MFDNILRVLSRIPEQQEISVDVVLDDDGYYDGTCPAPEERVHHPPIDDAELIQRPLRRPPTHRSASSRRGAR